MTDFSTMTDGELRRWIAERLGWTEIKEELSRMRDLEGEPISVWAGRDTSGEVEYIPDWPNDANAALELFKQFHGIGLEWFNNRWTIASGTKWLAGNDSAARAICEAWAQWHEAKESE